LPARNIRPRASVRSPDSAVCHGDGLRRRVIWQTELEAVDPPTVDPFADFSFDRPQLALFGRRHERHGVAGGAGAGGASHAVNVVLGLDRDIEVDHVRQRLDVDAS
jgi:hypothetical protein